MPFLCFSGCDKDEKELPIICVFPSHPALFVQGNVIDKLTEAPIQGIEVKYKFPEPFMPPDTAWTRITDEKGNYRLPAISGVVGGLFVVVTDIDGLYKPHTIYLKFNSDDGDFKWQAEQSYAHYYRKRLRDTR